MVKKNHENIEHRTLNIELLRGTTKYTKSTNGWPGVMVGRLWEFLDGNSLTLILNHNLRSFDRVVSRGSDNPVALVVRLRLKSDR